MRRLDIGGNFALKTYGEGPNLVRLWKKKPRPKTASQAEMQKILEGNGWVRTLGGKHVVKMEKESHRPITLPRCNGQQYSQDLTARIFKQAGVK